MNGDLAPLEIALEVKAPAGDEIAFVRPSGEIDLSNSEELAVVLGSPSCARSDGIVLDLTRVSFMDSSGLRVVLVSAQERSPSFATVVEEGSAVAELLELVDVGDRLTVVSDEDEALARIREAASE